MSPIINELYAEAYLTASRVNRFGEKAAATPAEKRLGIWGIAAQAWKGFAASLARAEYRFPPDYYLGP